LYEVVVIETPTLGDRSYLVHDGESAFVVDPQRDIDRVLAVAEHRGVRVTDVFETHIHNDYISGGYALAQLCHARYHVHADDPVTFERQPIADGDRARVSRWLTVRAVATPGHTHTHLAYVLEHDGQTVAVFSGGSLLYGSTGRPDLLGPDHTQVLVHAQWASAHRLATIAPDDAALFPTHGFGSFCSASQSEASRSTIGTERRTNPALLQAEQSWVDDLLAGLDAWPAYYVHMAPANLAGPGAADLGAAAVADAEEIRRRINAGEWVVDLRHRQAFCERHVTGTLNVGLDGSFATYLGWVIPWGTPVTILGETAEDVAAAQRELSRIGIDRPVVATGGIEAWSGSAEREALRRAGFTELADALKDGEVAVLDVRRRLEWDAGHIAGAQHIPLHELGGRTDEVPDGEVWVHCRSGYRATIAASMLARAGRQVVLVDDDFSVAATVGLVAPGPTPAGPDAV
jgi:glyoxylase-like metal-dependent hydrolase (beta-lactamase superfamily II)/rhodanese-related sulfurtransferase